MRPQSFVPWDLISTTAGIGQAVPAPVVIGDEPPDDREPPVPDPIAPREPEALPAK